MSFDQHDMFRERLNAMPLSAGRRGVAAMVLVEIVRWMPEEGAVCSVTVDELGDLLNLRLGEVLSAVGTLAELGSIELIEQGAVTLIRLVPMALAKCGQQLGKEIGEAIHFHTAWKRRLRHAIDTGQTDISVEDVARDDHCDFGRWLYGPALSDADRNGAYENICQLHKQFHRIAAATLQLALSNKKKEAEQAMSATGIYARASTRLIWALSGWRRVVAT